MTDETAFDVSLAEIVAMRVAYRLQKAWEPKHLLVVNTVLAVLHEFPADSLVEEFGPFCASVSCHHCVPLLMREAVNG